MPTRSNRLANPLALAFLTLSQLYAADASAFSVWTIEAPSPQIHGGASRGKARNCGCEDGVDGQDGEDGEDGRDGVDGEEGVDGRDGVDGRQGRPGWSLPSAQATPYQGPAAASAAEADPFFAGPGDTSTVRVAAPIIIRPRVPNGDGTTTGNGNGTAVVGAFRLYRAIRSLDRRLWGGSTGATEGSGSPFYERFLAARPAKRYFMGAFDSFEVSTVVTPRMRTPDVGDPRAVGNRVTVAGSIDLVELSRGAPTNGAPGSGSAAVARCVKDRTLKEFDLKTSLPSAAAMKIIHDCRARDAWLYMGANAAVDIQEVGRTPTLTQYHANLVVELTGVDPPRWPRVRNLFSWTSQAGVDQFLGNTDFSQAAAPGVDGNDTRGTNRSSANATTRASVNLPYVSLRGQVGGHWHTVGGGSFAAFAAGASIRLPFGVTVTPAWSRTVYNGTPENVGFINIGIAGTNAAERYPVAHWIAEKAKRVVRP